MGYICLAVKEKQMPLKYGFKDYVREKATLVRL